MPKEYYTKLNELVDELYIRATPNRNITIYTEIDEKYNQLKGYLSALQTLTLE